MISKTENNSIKALFLLLAVVFALLSFSFGVSAQKAFEPGDAAPGKISVLDVDLFATAPTLLPNVSPTAEQAVTLGSAYTLTDLNSGKIFTDTDNDKLTYYYQRSTDGETWGEKVVLDNTSVGGFTTIPALTENFAGTYYYRFHANDGTADSTDTWTLTLRFLDPATTDYLVTFYVGFDANGSGNNPTLKLFKTTVDSKGIPVTDSDGFDTYDSATEITPEKNEMDQDGKYRVYTYKVKGGYYSYRGFNKDGGALGGMCVSLPSATSLVDGNITGGDVYLRTQPVRTTSLKSGTAKDFFDKDSYYTKMICPVMNCTVTPGTSYVTNGYTYYPYLIYAAGNNCLYNIFAYAKDDYTFVEGYDKWSFGAIMNQTVTAGNTANSAKNVTLSAGVTFNLTVPNGAEAAVYYQYNNFNTKEMEAVGEPVVNGDKTTYTYLVQKSGSNWTYRVSKAGFVTKAGWFSVTEDTNMEVTLDSTAVKSHTANLGSTVSQRDEADLYLGSSAKGFVSLDSAAESYRMRAYRIWEIINGDSANIMVEPDFHYAILQGNATVNALDGGNATGNWLDVDPTGTAIMAVNYDAIDVNGSTTHGGFYPATSAERTAIAVLSDTAKGTASTDITASGTLAGSARDGINWDYNYDTWYFVNSGDTMDFHVNATGAATVKYALATTNAETMATTLSSWETAAASEGLYKVPLSQSGTVILEITDDTGVSYQCVRVVKATITVANASNIGEDIMAGDEVSVTFENTYRSISKMSGIFNPTTLLVNYTGEDKTEYSASIAQYMALDKASLKLKIPGTFEVTGDTQDYLFSNGYNYIKAMFSSASPFQVVYGMTDTGVGTNFSAVQVSAPFSHFPDIAVSVHKTVTYDVKISAVDGSTAISGAAGSLSDSEGNTLTADEDGIYQDLAYGAYSYTVSKGGYVVNHGEFSLGSATASEEVAGIVTKTISMTAAAENAWDGQTKTEPQKENDCYQIGTGAELAWFADHVNNTDTGISGCLTGDIDLAGYDWTPIGTSAKPFAGNFNGKGHKIYHLSVYQSLTAKTALYQGLFGSITGASEQNRSVIKNIVLQGNIKIYSANTAFNGSNAYVGGLTGYAKYTEISGCVVDVDVLLDFAAGNWSYTGGIAAYSQGAKIVNCLNQGDVSGYQYVGGVTSYLAGGSLIENAGNNGDIYGASNYIGGICAYIHPTGTAASGSNTMKNCIQTGKVTARGNYAGGLTAYVGGSTSGTHTHGTVENSFSTQVVSGGNTAVGSLIGTIVNAYPIVNNVYTQENLSANVFGVNGTETEATILTDTEMKAAAFVTTLNENADDDIFVAVENGYPAFRWQTLYTEYLAVDTTVDAIDALGTITEDSGDAIAAARAAFNGLTPFQKNQITNYDALVKAEIDYATLTAAKVVMDKIDAIGAVTIDSEAAITEARTAYDGLSNAQKDGVKNYNTLITAEQKLVELKAEAGDLTAAQYVEGLINALPAAGAIVYDTESDIRAARSAYTALSEKQQKKVGNYETLVAAEEALAQYKDDHAVTAYFSLSDDDKFVIANDDAHTLLWNVPVKVVKHDLSAYGLDGFINAEIEGPTVLDLYLTVLEKYYLNRQKLVPGETKLAGTNYCALTITGSAGSLYMSNFWGHDENLTYYVDRAYPLASPGWGATSDSIALKNGTVVDLSMFTDWSFYNDENAGFRYFLADDGETAITEKDIHIGDKLTLTYAKAGADWGGTYNTTFTPMANAAVKIGSSYGTATSTATTNDQGKTTVSFDKAGTYYVWVDGQIGKDSTEIVSAPAMAKINVTLDTDSVDLVLTAIEALPGADDVTVADKESIQNARSAFEKLTSEQQELISAVKLNKLLAAEKALAKAEEEQQNQAAIDDVIAKITTIGTVNADSKAAIDAARSSYDALTEAQQAKVTNIADLIAAEKIFAGLQESAKAVNDVIQKIAAIGTVNADSKAAIDAARSSYDALTKAQQVEVTNAADLIAAEKAYAKLLTDTFTDVKASDWYYDDVMYMAEKGYMKGNTATEFDPDGKLSRAMFVTVLYRISGSSAVNSSNAFTDVAADEWYTEAVNWAYANGVTTGISATEFGTNLSISREDMSLMIHRFAVSSGITLPDGSGDPAFADDKAIADYAKAAVYSLKKANIINGEGDNIFNPKGTATRAQCARILHLIDVLR